MFDSSPGINKLGGTMVARMNKQVNAKTQLPLDFAEIQGDGSLLANTFPKPVPKGQYSVLRHLTLGNIGDELTETQLVSAEIQDISTDEEQESTDVILPHEHKVLLPESMRSLMPGDRVLVALVNNEYVVIDIVTSS